MNILVVSTSLNAHSRSQKLAEFCGDEMGRKGCRVERIKLSELNIPLCDGETTWEHPAVKKLQQAVLRANAIVIAAPIYNWSVAASTKNFVESVGHALDNKVVAFLCAAGGPRALLAPAGLASSMIFDFQAIIVPKIIVVGKESTPEDPLSEETRRRITEMVDLTVRISSALGQAERKA